MTIDVKRIDPFLLPSVALGERDNLPDVGGIYFVIAGKSILYIGQSCNIHARWNGSHHRINQIKSYDNVIISWISVIASKKQDLKSIEEACIEHFNPQLNGTITPSEFTSGCPLTVSFGKRMRQVRKQKGITQAQLSKISGFTDRYIRNLERGERWPEARTLEIIAKVLDVEVKEFFEFSRPVASDHPKKAKGKPKKGKLARQMTLFL